MRRLLNDPTLSLAVLIVLALASFGLSYLPLPALLSSLLALSIAALKVAVIALFFMELAQHGGGVRIVAWVAPLAVVILIALMLGDVWTR